MGLLLGIYIGVALCTFMVVGFFVIMSKDSSGLWKPFVYAPFWFITIPATLIKHRVLNN